MKKLALLCLLTLLLTASVSAAARSEIKPRRDIVGLRLDMTKEDAHSRLQKIGTLQREERKRQEVWEVRDPYFSHVIVGFDRQSRVRFVTAVAREGGQRMRYSDVANLKKARQEGDASINNYNYVWELAARGRQPKALVVARGRDPQFLSTYSIKKSD
ncbi:MAG TPA: hypothetical protein VN256_18385 [Pyrinomonadaceae bacterium]|nr:hypothetical protein [Pyrinomonadaceae bacterium]